MSTDACACSGTTFVSVPPLTTVVCTVIPRRGSFNRIKRSICSASSCTALTPFSGSIPACAERPVTIISAPPDSLALRFQTPIASIRRLQHQHRVAPSRFPLDRPPRTLAANLLIRSPQENKSLRSSDASRAQSIHGKERQNQAALHIKSPRPPSPPTRHAKRHFRKRPQRIHRIHMPKHHNLSSRFPRAQPNFRAQVIPALRLPQNPHARPTPFPFARHKPPATVHSTLIVTRRFATHKFAKQFHHRTLVAHAIRAASASSSRSLKSLRNPSNFHPPPC